MSDIIDLMINILNRELSEAEVGEIPPDFYEALSIRIKELILLETTSPSDEGAEAAKTYRELISGLICELVDHRIWKALNKMLSGDDVQDLTKEEKAVIMPIYELLKRSHKLKDLILHGLTENLRASQNTEELHYTLVKFIGATDKFIGADLRTYGPYEKSDLADLPKDNAKVLIDKNIAIDVSVLE